MEAVSIVVQVLSVAASIATVVTLIVGIRQLSAEHKWRRAEFLASVVRDFEGDERFAVFRRLVDYTNTSITYRGVSFRMTEEELARALDLPESRRVNGAVGTAGYTESEHAVREVFDFWFDFLARCGAHAQRSLLSPHDVKPVLVYWLDNLELGISRHDDATLAALRAYAQKFHKDAIRFAATLGYPRWERDARVPTTRPPALPSSGQDRPVSASTSELNDGAIAESNPVR